MVDANLPRKLLINNEDELERVLHDANYETFELMPISQEIVQVQVKKNKGYERIGLRTNIIIGSYVTSLARTEMFKAMMKLDKDNIKLFYTDTGMKFFIKVYEKHNVN